MMNLEILNDDATCQTLSNTECWTTPMPFTVDCMYPDNGKEFKGAFKALCKKNTIAQKFTQPYTPQTNGKA